MTTMLMQFGCALVLVAAPVASGAAPEDCPPDGPSMRVPAAPVAVRRGGRSWLAYELEFAGSGNHCPRPVGVRVLDADSGSDLGVFPAGTTPGADRIYVDLELPQVPRRLAHRLQFEAAGGAAMETAGPDIDVLPTSILLSPPVAGGPWIAVYDPRHPRGHRRFVYSKGGEDFIPGRHAIDWFATAADGSLHRGNGAALAQWHGFGIPVLAVDDAEVVDVLDGYSDRAPNAAFDDSPGTGNLVVLRLEAGRYAFYEHLRQGSVRVRAGDRVTAGQVIAALGNSGHSMTPHLHFHLADGTVPLLSEGMPYRLDEFAVLGCHSSIETALAGVVWESCAEDGTKRGEFPLPNQVVRFPESRTSGTHGED